MMGRRAGGRDMGSFLLSEGQRKLHYQTDWKGFLGEGRAHPNHDHVLNRTRHGGVEFCNSRASPSALLWADRPSLYRDSDHRTIKTRNRTRSKDRISLSAAQRFQNQKSSLHKVSLSYPFVPILCEVHECLCGHAYKLKRRSTYRIGVLSRFGLLGAEPCMGMRVWV